MKMKKFLKCFRSKKPGIDRTRLLTENNNNNTQDVQFEPNSGPQNAKSDGDSSRYQTLKHLDHLLQSVSTVKDIFALMNWVQTYQSEEKLCRPVETLLNGWWEKAKNKLSIIVKTYLDKILQHDRDQEDCYRDEDYIHIYVDTIQCINAVLSQELYVQVKETCFKELLTFVTRYAAEKKKALGKKVDGAAEMDKPITTHFLKTLKTCKELRKYVQTEDTIVTKEIMSALEELEADTLKLLMKFVSGIAEKHFKVHFKSDKRQFLLLDVVEKHFPKLQFAGEEQLYVMDEAYKILAQTYLQHLIKSSQSKLKKCWCPNIEQRIREEAEQLHKTMSDLAPSVNQRNCVLLQIPEVLDCKSIDPLKLIVGRIEKECLSESEDVQLLPDVLRWKGLSKVELREVLDALPDSQIKCKPQTLFCCFSCC
ncbi:uncharacterized protein KZ484_014005 isoform 2-T2 [Pholidichthys leucotaenia]